MARSVAFSGETSNRRTRVPSLRATISVPEGGATLSFWAWRDTEPTGDLMFVEAP